MIPADRLCTIGENVKIAASLFLVCVSALWFGVRNIDILITPRRDEFPPVIPIRRK